MSVGVCRSLGPHGATPQGVLLTLGAAASLSQSDQESRAGSRHVRQVEEIHSATGQASSCGLLVIVFQEPTKPFVASDGTRMLLAVMGRRHEDHIALTLMWTFLVKMRHVCCECTA